MGKIEHKQQYALLWTHGRALVFEDIIDGRKKWVSPLPTQVLKKRLNINQGHIYNLCNLQYLTNRQLIASIGKGRTHLTLIKEKLRVLTFESL